MKLRKNTPIVIIIGIFFMHNVFIGGSRSGEPEIRHSQVYAAMLGTGKN
jgi:hypothetical protein